MVMIIVTPHPDDETLGCGGSILKFKAEGHEVHWLIVTHISRNGSQRVKREKEIQAVNSMYAFDSLTELSYNTSELNDLKDGQLIQSISNIFKNIEPTTVFVPYPGDIHSDHQAVFNATVACTKWFRYPTIEKVLVYETLSETDFTINPDTNGFRPNVFINIEGHLEKKIEIMNIYHSEIGTFPFPRSEKAIRSLAYVRGAAAGFEAAEAFMLLKERVI